MRKGIHPKSHKIRVQMTNGVEFFTKSTRGKDGDSVILQVDPHNHPLWTKKTALGLTKESRFASYKSKYGNLSMFAGADKNTPEAE